MNTTVLFIRLVLFLSVLTYEVMLLIGSVIARDYISMAVICVAGALLTTNRDVIVGVKSK